MTSRTQLLAYLLIVGAGLLFSASAPSDAIDNAVLDARFSWQRAQGARSTTPEIVIVGLDEASFEELREPFALWHPHFGRLFQALADAAAGMVAVDMVLPSKRYREFFTGDAGLPDHDRTLLLGLRALGTAQPPIPFYLGQAVRGACPTPLLAPVLSLARRGLGVVSIPQDSDGTVRRYLATIPVASACTSPGAAAGLGRYPTLVGAVAETRGQAMSAGFIDYSLGPPYEYVPLQAVLGWQAAGDTRHLRSVFEGKIVFVGGVTTFEDRVQLPVALAAWEPGRLILPGVLVHAQALRTLQAHGNLITPVAASWTALLVLAAGAAWFVAARPWPGIAAFVLMLAALVLGAGYALSVGKHLPIAAAGCTALLGCAARWISEGIRIHADRRRLRTSFSAYVSPNVMKEIESGAIKSSLYGARQKVCLLFSDIRGFTTRSAQAPPEDIIQLLNRYFEEMTAAVHRHEGTVDKFIGDGLMAFFGAPNALPNASRNAMAAAREMFDRLDRLNGELQRQGQPPILIGVGLHTGDVVVGHMGSRGRHAYTVIGDNVNLASRVEGKTKDLGFPLLCTKDVLLELDATETFVPLGLQPIKGRDAVELYGWKRSAPPGQA